MNRSAPQRNRQAGFSLIEVMVSILVLTIIMGAVFAQVNNVQKKTKVESLKLDLTQEGREFVDQFVRDIHMSGYPTSKLFQTTTTATTQSVALGLVLATPTEMRFEGDVYGDGNANATVYTVSYKYFAVDPDPNCPCVRRSVAPKDPAVNPVTGYPNPIYYTEVQNVIDPTGMAQVIFTYFQASGDPVDVGAGININTGVNTGYRHSNLAYFAARSGVEELRDRIRVPSGTDPNGLNDSLPTTSIGQPGGVVYVTNPTGGETVKPWDPTNAYFDDELCHEIANTA